MANNFELVLDIDAWVPDETATPGRAVVQDRPFWSFEDTPNQIIRSKSFRMPANFTGAGTLKAAIDYKMATAVVGTLGFLVAIESISEADAQNLNTGSYFDTDNAGSDTVPITTAGRLGQGTIILTNDDSAAIGDMVRLRIARDTAVPGNAVGNAHLLGITFFEEI